MDANVDMLTPSEASISLCPSYGTSIVLIDYGRIFLNVSQLTK
jgi:hypothetical protein